MPHDIQLDRAPIGLAMSTAVAEDQVAVAIKGFHSFDDPDSLVRSLDSFYGAVLSFLPSGVMHHPDLVQIAAAVIWPDGRTRVWLNELSMHAEALPRRTVSAGQAVSVDDIADVQRLDLGIVIPPEAGFAITFCVRWERVFFYDFQPLADRKPRVDDIGAELGRFYTYLLHRRRLSLDDDTWSRLIADGWFPFILLSEKTIDLMVDLSKQGRSADLVISEIAAAVVGRLDTLATEWASKLALAPEVPFLERAIERYRAGDWVSCVSVLYPRIEGVLRSVVQPTGRIGHVRLATTVIEGGKTRLSPTSPLLADRFLEYLKSSLLQDFDPTKPAGLSRHTVGHGVATPTEFSQKNALLGFLVLHQLSFFL